MNWILILFIFFMLIACLAWAGKYRLSFILFSIFFVCAIVVFVLDISQKLSIQL